MRAQNLKINKGIKNILVLIFMATLAIGCAEQKIQDTSSGSDDDTPVSTLPYVPPGTEVLESQSLHWDSGATVSLILEPLYTDKITDEGLAKINNLLTFSGEELNVPTNVQLNINLEWRGTGWGGRIMTGFDDDAGFYQYTMVNGDEEIYDRTPLGEAAAYNNWFELDGQAIFHGFFQDSYGGVIIVFDELDSPGDGIAPTKVNGSIWYKVLGNFEGTTMPTEHCWYINKGPNDCRAWVSGKGMNSTSAINPDNGYVKLGAFTGLDVVEAFGEDVLVD